MITMASFVLSAMLRSPTQKFSFLIVVSPSKSPNGAKAVLLWAKKAPRRDEGYFAQNLAE
jgi:hypothetical protein